MKESVDEESFEFESMCRVIWEDECLGFFEFAKEFKCLRLPRAPPPKTPPPEVAPSPLVDEEPDPDQALLTKAPPLPLPPPPFRPYPSSCLCIRRDLKNRKSLVHDNSMRFKINLCVCQFSRSFYAMLILKRILCIVY